jgi:hypothetical protein
MKKQVLALLCPAVLAVSALLASNTALAQSVAAAPSKTAAQMDAEQAKRWSLYWGWNRSTYTSGDIHFKGVDHDFTLKNVAAADMQTDATMANVAAIYLRPSEITIPQTNLRLAYQLNSDTAIALNLDHMKYVMNQNQTVDITGQIKGVAQSGRQVLSEDWLAFEHTDGLNIVSLEVEKQNRVYWFGERSNAKVFALAGIGVVMPKSNVTMGMIGQKRNDEFHIAGYSVSVGMGLELDIYKDVFCRTAYKMGYVEMPDVLTSSRVGDKASHNFSYSELLIAVGMRF